MREQASRRLEFVQERFQRMASEVAAMRAENDELRRRVHDLQNAEPEHAGMERVVGRAVGMGAVGVKPPPQVSTEAAPVSAAGAAAVVGLASPGAASEPSPTLTLQQGLQLARGQGIF